MKLIDLLNDIANGNTLPDKILVFDDIFTLDKDAKDYKDAEGYYLFEDYSLIKFLNEEVKILEITVTMKQDKKIEKLDATRSIDDGTEICKIKAKINEIIEAINEALGDKE